MNEPSNFCLSVECLVARLKKEDVDRCLLFHCVNFAKSFVNFKKVLTSIKYIGIIKILNSIKIEGHKSEVLAILF